MTGASFRLYDALDLAALAILEEPAAAERAWTEACISAYGLHEPGSDPDTALHRLLGAARPGSRDPGRRWLWNALNAASCAALAAMEGDPEAAAIRLRDAHAAGAMLTGDTGYAYAVILGEIRAMAETGAAA